MCPEEGVEETGEMWEEREEKETKEAMGWWYGTALRPCMKLHED